MTGRTLTDEARLAVLESEMRDVKSDLDEIKRSIKTLETIASTGNGAFRTILFIGGLLGYVFGFVMALVNLFRVTHGGH